MTFAVSQLTDAVSKGFSTLAIFLIVLLALLLVVALLALVWPAARRLLVGIRDVFAGRELWIAWAIALAATLGSLYYSEIADFIPCRLCWYQRIAMYPLVVILLVGALRRDVRATFQYAIAFPVVGALIASYHLYIEAHPEAESAGCKIGAPCSTKWIDEFGFVTIPLLAISAFGAIVALLLLARSRASSGAQAPDDAPATEAPAAA